MTLGFSRHDHAGFAALVKKLSFIARWRKGIVLHRMHAFTYYLFICLVSVGSTSSSYPVCLLFFVVFPAGRGGGWQVLDFSKISRRKNTALLSPPLTPPTRDSIPSRRTSASSPAGTVQLPTFFPCTSTYFTVSFCVRLTPAGTVSFSTKCSCRFVTKRFVHRFV